MDFPVPDYIQRIIIRLSNTILPDDISKCIGVDLPSVQKIISHFGETGELDLSKCRPHCDPNIYTTLNNIPDIYLEELRLERNEASISAVWRSLLRDGFTMKRVSPKGIEQIFQKRTEYAARMATYQANQLVFLGESALNRRVTYRNQPWVIRGTKATRASFHCIGEVVTLLPALNLGGLLNMEVSDGTITQEEFKYAVLYLLDSMKPFPAPNSVIVMDACPMHKRPDIQALIEARGMRCEFLPPYSPDFNPVELALSSLKHQLRREDTLAQLTDIKDVHCELLSEMYRICGEGTSAMFRRCGYL